MIILDENIPRNQRELLISWRFSIKQIGYDFGRKGIQDDEIVPLLHQGRQLTFVTRDSDFFRRKLCHNRYCLLFLDVDKSETAYFVRRVLRKDNFDTQAKRMGLVIKASHVGLALYQKPTGVIFNQNWD